MNNQEILLKIIEGDLQTLYNLIEPIKEDTKELTEAYKKMKYGITIKYHIEYNLRGHAKTYEKTQEVILNNKTYHLEDWWNEEEERRAITRKALMNYYGEEDSMFEGR